MVKELILILGTILLILLNGFFVAVEFALVKVRRSRLEEMERQKLPFAKTARWMSRRLDRALSACQLGITMASLGLGWIGEPAIARLIEPVIHKLGVTSPAVVHTIAFIFAFSLITAAHLVIGEQVPKIYAIRRPGPTSRWCALPLKWFYYLSYPFLMALNATTVVILRRLGVESGSEHEAPHSEEEIRALLGQAHVQGELTGAEHRLLDAVFEFDDAVCRQIMVPRIEVSFLDVNKPFAEAMQEIRHSKHTRYPVCDGSLDRVLGFVHIKDLFMRSDDQEPDLRAVCRPPRYVPETTPLSRLLNLFKASHLHLFFVVNEYGSVAGVVTLENVLEQIVGAVQDEFDDEMPAVVPEGSGSYLIQGGALITEVNKALNTELYADGIDTLAGLITGRLGRIAETGDRVDLDGVAVEVLEVQNSRPTRIRATVSTTTAANDD